MQKSPEDWTGRAEIRYPSADLNDRRSHSTCSSFDGRPHNLYTLVPLDVDLARRNAETCENRSVRTSYSTQVVVEMPQL